MFACRHLFMYVWYEWYDDSSSHLMYLASKQEKNVEINSFYSNLHGALCPGRGESIDRRNVARDSAVENLISEKSRVL